MTRYQNGLLSPLAAVVVLLLLALIGAACAPSSEPSGDRALVPDILPDATTISSGPSTGPIPTATPVVLVRELDEIPFLNVSMREWRDTNFRRILADLDPRDIISGGPPKNGIPPIYQPQFISIQDAETLEWMTDDQPMTILEWNGDARAYPLGILTFHEVVNDIVGGEPILVTYCPLCYTSIAFKRTFGDTVLNFGTTGNVRDSNLVMWDDVSESWWQQITGEAILGDMAGAQLEFVPVFTTSFGEFKATYPEGTVLSPASGALEFQPYYGRSQYYRYDSPNNRPFLFTGDLDERIDPVGRILGLQIEETTIAFPFTVLEDHPVTETTIEGRPVVVFWKPGTRSALDIEEIALARDVGSAAAFDPTIDGQVLTFVADEETGAIRDTQTGSTWSILGIALDGPLASTQLETLNGENGLWFSWAIFRPDTQIYAPPDEPEY